MPTVRPLLMLSLSLFLFAACDAEPSSDPGQEAAGPTASAVSAGSCEGSCGGQSPDGCWCDEVCESYGNCCDDYQPICAGSCEGSCGSQSPDGCWCNSSCTSYGDCCPDYEAACVSSESFPGLSNWDLLSALRIQASSGHQGLNYDNARSKMYGKYCYGTSCSGIDVIGGKVEGIYTGVTATADGTRAPGVINTEHSWPKSDGADYYPINGDIHHMFPSASWANAARGSYDYGNVSCSGSGCDWEQAGSKLDNNLFMVRSSRRGDIARAHFYIAMRYNKRIGSAEEAVLRTWHNQDPPDSRERTRNDMIEDVQGNRNPFVDEPALVGRISNF